MAGEEPAFFMPGRWRFTMRKTGFTLVELLVVVTIIAVLAAILLPVFAFARQSAHRSVCLSNVRQLALGVQMYADDYEETYPLLSVPIALGSDKSAEVLYGEILPWQGLIRPYTKSAGVAVWIDADDKFDAPAGPAWSYSLSVRPEIGGHAFWQDQMEHGEPIEFTGVAGAVLLDGWYSWPIVPSPSKTLAQIETPSTMALLYDAGAFDGYQSALATYNYAVGGADHPILGWCDWVTGSNGYYRVGFLARHMTRDLAEANCDRDGKHATGGGSGNLAFCDGHAKSLTIEQFYRAEPRRDFWI